MYVSEIPTYTKSGKLSHIAILLRQSYRENGLPKTRTVAGIEAKLAELQIIARIIDQGLQQSC